MSIQERVIGVIVKQLEAKREQVTPDASFVDDLGADSLDTVELVMAMEEEFGLEISDDEAESMKRVKDVIAYLEKRLGNK